MRIHVVTVLPDLLRGSLDASIVGRARRRGLVEVELVDPRRWAEGRHKKVDDRPFGGGPGMVIAAPPVAGALDHLLAREPGARLLITSPQGRRLDQAWVRELAAAPAIAILCGHYEGIDERIAELYHPEPFSLGDFVLSGGEPAALALVDAVVRLQPGALGNVESAIQDSFAEDGSYDHPCFTRPRIFRDREVPQALIDGDHAGVAAWRAAERVRRTPPLH